MSDYRLPKENGLVAVARLRSALGYTVPVIMMTGDTSRADIKLQNVDNLTVVQKPFDPDALMALVHKVAARLV